MSAAGGKRGGGGERDRAQGREGDKREGGEGGEKQKKGTPPVPKLGIKGQGGGANNSREPPKPAASFKPPPRKANPVTLRQVPEEEEEYDLRELLAEDLTPAVKRRIEEWIAASSAGPPMSDASSQLSANPTLSSKPGRPGNTPGPRKQPRSLQQPKHAFPPVPEYRSEAGRSSVPSLRSLRPCTSSTSPSMAALAASAQHRFNI